MNILRTIKSITLAGSLLAVASLGATAAATPNTSSYSLSVSGNTVNVYETNSESVNAVGANFVYSGGASAFNISAAAGSTFSTCVGSVSAYSLSCANLGGGAAAGTHLVASLTFTPTDPTSDATVSVSMSNSSQVLSSTDNTDTLNHANLPSTSYSYTAPAVQSTSDNSAADSSADRTSAATSAPAAATATDTPASIGDSASTAKSTANKGGAKK